MGALEAVLQFKEQERQRQEANNAAVGNAVQLFSQARQQAQENQLKSLLVNAQVKNYENDALKDSRSNELLTKALSGTPGAAGSPRIKSINVGGVNIEVPQSEEQIQRDLDIKDRQENVKQVSKARKDLDTYTSDAMQSLVALDKIEAQAKELGEFRRGFLEQTAAKISTGVGSYSKDEKITKYLGVLSQELIPMARKLMEEKGPITESDVDRVEKGFGEITVPLEDKIFLAEELRNKVREALKNKSQVAEISEEEFKGKYKSLYEKLNRGNAEKSDKPKISKEAAIAELKRRGKL